jgi:hypothetical protein
METESEPAVVVNMELVNQVFTAIESDVKHWNQSGWDTGSADGTSFCNTSFCFGGWTLHLMKRLKIEKGGYIIPLDENGNRSYFETEAAKLLGFNMALAFAVFYNMEHDFELFKTQVLADIERIGKWNYNQVQAWLNDGSE